VQGKQRQEEDFVKLSIPGFDDVRAFLACVTGRPDVMGLPYTGSGLAGGSVARDACLAGPGGCAG
jgi:hypothetical protein